MPARKRTRKAEKPAPRAARDDAPKQLTPEEIVGRIVVGVERREEGSEALLVLRLADGECPIRVVADE